MPARIHLTKLAFEKLSSDSKTIDTAIENLKYWLLHPSFEEYHDQIDFMIESEQFEELFDCFYQVIPFGTAGRRGLVGIGPNRINPWTIAASAQGHSQFLLKKYGTEAKKRGIVIAYDVRQYMNTEIYGPHLHNPIFGLSSKDLAETAATVYAKNAIPVHFFNDIASTPQLSFTIRKLNTLAGINISASHNPRDYNGKKVFDEYGGQLIPPYDQELADEVNNNVPMYEVDIGLFSRELHEGKINLVSGETEQAYEKAVAELSISQNRVIRIAYSPLHGTGKRTVFKVLKQLGFDVHIEPESSIPSGEFETVPNHIANPELPEVFERLKLFADEIQAEIIITTDPDADRVGFMIRTNENTWKLLSGNEMILLLTKYLFNKNKKGKIFATIPVTRLLDTLCKRNNITLNHQLLPGFKYIASEMNELEEKGEMDTFLLGAEDTFGHIRGNYAREKDGLVAAILLSEFAGELKEQKKTLIDNLDEIYAKFGYVENETISIKFEHSYELSKMQKLMNEIRESKGNCFTPLEIESFKDHWTGKAFVSETEKSSRNLLEFEIKPEHGTTSCRMLIRPSGTEPKLKLYFECAKTDHLEQLEGNKDIVKSELGRIRQHVVEILTNMMEK
ncbi:phospho-sugar mutase [Candidatus Dojkabacteria bacterium]|uniref:Phospho-sugar mutase n=1 Tax=Candidatus Dojkabacteria bacterium TaxID=2099670 RepID=A0A955L7P7_9BACT|nr:phospho-sugar mutase [Candidatus Dojkabacteria bacterium]